MKQIRVLHVITSLDQGGAESMVAKLCAELDSDRFDNRVVSLMPDGVLAPTINALGTPVSDLGMTKSGPYISVVFKLCQIIREVRPDVVQSWLYHADLLATVAWLLTRQGALAWNLRCSDLDMSQYSNTTKWVLKALKMLSRVPSVIVSNSHRSCRIHEMAGYRARAWEVIANGFDLKQFNVDAKARCRLRAEWGVDDGDVLIGLPARHDPQKDHRTFLEALNLLRSQGHPVVGVLVGQGTKGASIGLPDDQIARAAQKLPLIRLGRRFDMSDIYNALDIVALSSAFGEGFPNVLGEALASGIPAVATDVGDSHVILDGFTEVVPPRNPVALAAELAKLLEMTPEARIRLGLAGRQRIHEKYSLPAISECYAKLYTELSNKC